MLTTNAPPLARRQALQLYDDVVCAAHVRTVADAKACSRNALVRQDSIDMKYILRRDYTKQLDKLSCSVANWNLLSVTLFFHLFTFVSS